MDLVRQRSMRVGERRCLSHRFKNRGSCGRTGLDSVLELSLLAAYSFIKTKPSSGSKERVTSVVFQMKPPSAEVNIVICVQFQAEEDGCESRLVFSDFS